MTAVGVGVQGGGRIDVKGLVDTDSSVVTVGEVDQGDKW